MYSGSVEKACPESYRRIRRACAELRQAGQWRSPPLAVLTHSPIPSAPPQRSCPPRRCKLCRGLAVHAFLNAPSPCNDLLNSVEETSESPECENIQ
jgi:hypothetical protein